MRIKGYDLRIIVTSKTCCLPKKTDIIAMTQESSLPEKSVTRLNYFTGQLLVEGDFKDEQAYHRDMRHLHNRALHSPGVLEGMEVSQEGDQRVKISPGIALDKNGRELVLIESGFHELQITEMTQVSLVAKYKDELISNPNVNNDGDDSKTRIREVIEFRDIANLSEGSDESVILAQIILENGIIKNINQVNKVADTSSLWRMRNGNLHYTEGNVSIGTDQSTDVKLRVNGNLQLEEGGAVNRFVSMATPSLEPLDNDVVSVPTLAMVKSMIGAVKGELETVKGELETVKGELETVKGELETVKGELETVKGELETVKGELETVKGELETVKGELETVKGELTKARSEASNVIIYNSENEPLELEVGTTYNEDFLKGKGFGSIKSLEIPRNSIFTASYESPFSGSEQSLDPIYAPKKTMVTIKDPKKERKNKEIKKFLSIEIKRKSA